MAKNFCEISDWWKDIALGDSKRYMPTLIPMAMAISSTEKYHGYSNKGVLHLSGTQELTLK